jgi:hypothetical protein
MIGCIPNYKKDEELKFYHALNNSINCEKEIEVMNFN